MAKSQYLSVFLELSSIYKSDAKLNVAIDALNSHAYEYRIELRNPRDSGCNISRVFSSQFEVGECWGYNRYFKLDQLTADGFVSDTGSLEFIFHVRACTYSQHSCDQSLYNFITVSFYNLFSYISQLEASNSKLQIELDQIRTEQCNIDTTVNTTTNLDSPKILHESVDMSTNYTSVRDDLVVEDYESDTEMKPDNLILAPILDLNTTQSPKSIEINVEEPILSRIDEELGFINLQQNKSPVTENKQENSPVVKDSQALSYVSFNSSSSSNISSNQPHADLLQRLVMLRSMVSPNSLSTVKSAFQNSSIDTRRSDLPIRVTAPHVSAALPRAVNNDSRKIEENSNKQSPFKTRFQETVRNSYFSSSEETEISSNKDLEHQSRPNT